MKKLLSCREVCYYIVAEETEDDVVRSLQNTVSKNMVSQKGSGKVEGKTQRVHLYCKLIIDILNK